MASSEIQLPDKNASLDTKTSGDFFFKSQHQGPISEMPVLRRSLLFCEMTLASYLPLQDANSIAGKLGFTDGKVIRGGAIDVFWFQNEFDAVMVFRGKEIRELDQAIELQTLPSTMAETIGWVISDFKAMADGIWPAIEAELESNDRNLWFCGHSLGAAAATLCASRCVLSFIKSQPNELHTFGCPRVASRQYLKHVKLKHFRWVNYQDPVPQIPEMRSGFDHEGIEMCVDRFGRLANPRGVRRFFRRLMTRASELGNSNWMSISPHLAPSYVDAVFDIVRSEEAKSNSPWNTTSF
ncbi:lipase family protein [Mariniblastus sp.]|nr:lipase family protein [Mariniblastus sp.]